jgi:hypothetical protein
MEWWGDGRGVMVVVWLSCQMRKVGWGGWIQKPETKPLWLGCEGATRNSREGWWGGGVAVLVVVWPSRWMRKAGGGELDPKTRN